MAVSVCEQQYALRASDVCGNCGNAKQCPAKQWLGTECHDERAGHSARCGRGEPVPLAALPVELLADFPEFRRLQIEVDASLGNLLADAVEDGGEFAKRVTQLRQVFANVLEHGAATYLLVHPLLEYGLGGLPQVEFRIELAAEAFDVEERLMQKDHLGLN